MAGGKEQIARALRAITEDALFAVAATGTDDEDVPRGLAKRRVTVYENIGKGGKRRGIDPIGPWLATLAAAIAPVRPPVWMPMAEVVKGGTSLEGGPRGVRALFSAKPSEKEEDRVRRHGTLALRVLTAVLLADGPIDAEGDDQRACVAASLGLDDGAERALLVEPPASVDRITIDDDVEAKLCKAIVHGAWLAAASDGIDPREEAVVLRLARRLEVSMEDAEAARASVRGFVEEQRQTGNAVVDAVRYVLHDEPAHALLLGKLAARLFLPRVHRQEALAAVEQGAPVTLAERYRPGRAARGATLVAAWLAALHLNPSVSRRAELLARHDRFAEDLAAGGVGADARDRVDRLVEGELQVAARAAGL